MRSRRRRAATGIRLRRSSAGPQRRGGERDAGTGAVLLSGSVPFAARAVNGTLHGCKRVLLRRRPRSAVRRFAATTHPRAFERSQYRHTGNKAVPLVTPQRKIDRVVQRMRAAPTSVPFRDLEAVCQHYFGPARQSSGSHRVYATPWPGDPRVNIQNDHGAAKAYQVRQVLAAINELATAGHDNEKEDNDA